MDELFEGFIQGVGRAFGYLFVKILFEFFFYYIGWPVVKLVTLGSYPKRLKSYALKTDSHDGVWTSCIGVLICIFVVVIWFNHTGRI